MDSKHKQPQFGGQYKPESVRDVAESLGITNLSESVASALASDVEYRLHQVVEEAARFMRHARRTTVYPSDIDNALRVLNIEPLYGYSSANPPVFKRALPPNPNSATGPVYYIDDEEIDFERVLREEKITLPKGVSWTAHWLAVEGVQPLVPENPPAIPKDTGQDSSGTQGKQVNGTTPNAAVAAANKLHSQHLVKQVLSRELQLYYTRLTSSLLPPSASDHAKRAAALASLRNDAGLQALLPYLVRWIGEGIANVLKENSASENDGKILDILLDVIAALMDNSMLFVEPYLHQLLPPILSSLLHSSLPASQSTHLRTSASQTLSRLLQHHSTTYPSLAPRIMKTLLLALVSPGKSKGTREGAVRGLAGVGREAVRKGLVEGGGAKVIGSELHGEELSTLVDAVLDALQVLQPSSEDPEPLNTDMDTGDDAELTANLKETFGDFFAKRLMGDKEWVVHVLKGADGIMP